MAMIKISSPSDWDFNEPNVIPIKLMADGRLRPNDRGDFIKRAGDASSVFLPRLREIKIAADEYPVHIISHGASDLWGPNRNGDGFKEATCQKYAHTFEKFARAFRNHKNKDASISYGFPKLAAYNSQMHRVELLTLFNMTKAAAERNGGLVADKEIEKLASGSDLSTSMACRVPYDQCSYCMNKAASRADYCTASTCKAGGCKDNLTRLIKIGNDVHHLHVDNPDPCWFDSSTVFRPADRTAYGSRADYITKAASDHGSFGLDGIKMAEDSELTVPIGVILFQDGVNSASWGSPALERQVKLAQGLDLLEKSAAFQRISTEHRRAFATGVQAPVDFDRLQCVTQEKTAAALGALANLKIILPLRDFAKLTKRAELIDDAGRCLKGVFGRMIADGSLETKLAHNQYAMAEKLASVAQRKTAELMHESFSLNKEAVNQRCVLSAVRNQELSEHKGIFVNEKRASDSPLAEALVRDYAIYKIAALHRIAEFDEDFPTTARMALIQNQVN